MSGKKVIGGITNQGAYMCEMLEIHHLQKSVQTYPGYYNIQDTVLMPQI